MMVEDLDTGFVRHLGGVKEPHVEYLWEHEMVGFHFNNKPSADPDDYDSGNTEMERLNDFAQNGRIIGASYRRYTTSEMFVGVIKPQSDINILYFKNGEFVKNESVKPGQSINTNPSDEYHLIKAAKLDEAQIVKREKYPVLFGNARPPGAVIIPWWNVEDSLRQIVKDEPKPRDPSKLTSDQQEILCEEFLRIANKSYRSLRSVGGQTADVDIYGQTNKFKVWAEVTFGDENTVKSKLDKLSEYDKGDSRIYLFGPENSRPEEVSDSISYISIETTFEVVDLNQSGRKMIDKMLNIEAQS